MVTEDQSAVIEWLSRPATHHDAPVERIDTHISVVFLAGDRAWKLKRAVHFDYVDYATAERRRQMCEAEVALNRRTAPGLYLGVRAITREVDGSFAFDGRGPAVEWIVEMRRFEQEALLDRVAAKGALSVDVIEQLAAAVARFHRDAAPRHDHGGRAGMEWVVRGNAAGLAEFGARVLDAGSRGAVTRAAAAEIEQRGALLDRRRDEGYVRQCHGDLHLRNVVLLDGAPTLFDAIEFNDELSCIDVFYDLAFLLMDLWRRGLRHHANRVLNRYLADSNDSEALALLPLFLSCRAAIRAKTSLTAASVQEELGRQRELQEMGCDYLALARGLLPAPAPVMVAIGGVSGTGKSTVARAIAPHLLPVPGAVVLQSDFIRKSLCGVAPLERLGPEGYRPEVSARVYATLAQQAEAILSAGQSVIADAVFARPADRQAIEDVARRASVRFVGLWLQAPEPLLMRRIASRVGDVSDADAAVLRAQLEETTNDVTWQRLDASPPPEDVARDALDMLGVTPGKV